MKKLLICLALLCIFPLIFFRVLLQNRTAVPTIPVILPTTEVRLWSSSIFPCRKAVCPRRAYVYEGYKTETGVHLEHFIRSEYWDNTVSGNVSRHYRKSPRCERV